jgi:hypothetical protein
VYHSSLRFGRPQFLSPPKRNRDPPLLGMSVALTASAIVFDKRMPGSNQSFASRCGELSEHAHTTHTPPGEGPVPVCKPAEPS